MNPDDVRALRPLLPPHSPVIQWCPDTQTVRFASIELTLGEWTAALLILTKQLLHELPPATRQALMTYFHLLEQEVSYEENR